MELLIEEAAICPLQNLRFELCLILNKRFFDFPQQVFFDHGLSEPDHIFKRSCM
jgi:hypothetical protein